MSNGETRPESLDAIVVRLDSLEEENTRLRRVQRLFGAFALAVGVIVVLAAASFPRTVEVTDNNGILRSLLYADMGGGKPGLELRDPNGKARFAIRTNQNDDAWIEFFDNNGTQRLVMGIEVNGDSQIVIKDGSGNVRHRLFAPP